jgi:hypothetical protein
MGISVQKAEDVKKEKVRAVRDRREYCGTNRPYKGLVPLLWHRIIEDMA